MTTTMTIEYRTDTPVSPIAFSVSLVSSNEPVSELTQVGPVHNNVARYRGTFSSREKALREALEFIGCSCTIIEHRDPMAGSIVHSVKRKDYRPKYGDVLLASRGRLGTFIHA